MVKNQKANQQVMAKSLKLRNNKLGYNNYGREIYYTRKRSLAIR